MLTNITGAAPLSYCPKPNHIKPCWCGGVARCITDVKGRGCLRLARGISARCWQHKLKEGT